MKGFIFRVLYFFYIFKSSCHSVYISFPTLPLTSFRKKSVKIVHGQDNLVQLCVFCYYLHIQCAFDLKNLLILTKKISVCRPYACFIFKILSHR